MPSLRALGVAFAYSDAAPLIENATFQLEPGFTGLVGDNGAGKTTLLRLLAGELSPTGGKLHLEPRPPLLRFCRQEVDEASGELHLFAGSTEPLARRLHGRLRLEPTELSRWPTLSPGERKRWQVGAALAAEPDVLLLDEPGNHLDAGARELLVEALRRFRGVGVLVSHDRALLEALTTATLRVHRGSARLWPGAYSAARALWEAELEGRFAARSAAQAEVERRKAELAIARRAQESAAASRSAGRRMKSKHDSDARSISADFRAEQAEKGMGRKVSVLRAAAERAAAAIGEPPDKRLGQAIFARYERAPRPLLFSRGAGPLCAGGRVLLEAPALSVPREARIHLAGANGAGKSTLLAELLRGSPLPEGKLLVLPQELTAEQGRAALAEVQALPPEERGRALQLVAALGSDPDRLLASARPSPGEARKLILARGLAQSAWALVLDEPTNHLDLPSIERLESALAAFPGALLLVTHDDALARRTCTERWTLGESSVTISSL